MYNVSMFYGDYHTHTVFSHGKGTVEENVRAAIAKGLKAIALTDHGICGYPDNLNPADFDKFIAEVKRVRRLYPQIKILSGVETNLLGEDGETDLPSEFENRLDVILCGFHFARVPRSFGEFFGFWMPNMMPFKNRKKRVVKNTDAYIRALERYRIGVIAHPMRSCYVDIKALGEAAAKLGVYIELNSKSMRMTVEDICAFAQTGCRFICSSDAHSPDRIGDFSAADKLVQAGLSRELIVNFDNEPTFR